MNNNEYENEYIPQLSRSECDKFEKLNLSEKIAEEIAFHLSENTRLDKDDAVYWIEDAFAHLHFHYYPPLSEAEQIAGAIDK